MPEPWIDEDQARSASRFFLLGEILKQVQDDKSQEFQIFLARIYWGFGNWDLGFEPGGFGWDEQSFLSVRFWNRKPRSGGSFEEG
jgi:hypothetical protein